MISDFNKNRPTLPKNDLFYYNYMRLKQELRKKERTSIAD